MDYREKIEVARLANAPPSEVISWLEGNAVTEKPRWAGELRARRVSEFLLFRRNDAAINLALARFGTYAPVLRKLYKNGNTGMRLGVLTNSFVGPSGFMGPDCALSIDDIINLINGFPGTHDHLAAYFENSNIPRKTVEAVLERNEAFAFIDDPTFMHLIFYLSKNKMIQEPRDDTYLDGYAEFTHNQLFFALWKLVGTVPTTQGWAGVLTEIVKDVGIPFMGKEINFSLIERWRIEEPEEDDSGEASEIGGKRKFDPALSHSFWLRHALADRFLRHGVGDTAEAVTPEHQDKAVRLAYYGACKPEQMFDYFVHEKDFEYPNFEYIKKEDNYGTDDQRKVAQFCKECFERDKNEFIDFLIRNENFWRRKQERELLHTLAWDLAEDPNSNMDMPNALRACEARFVKEKPEYFKDDEFIDSNKEATVEDLVRSVVEQIEKIDDKLEGTQADEVLETQRSMYREIIDETQRRLEILNRRIVDQLEENSVEYFLSSLSERLQKIEGKLRRPTWSTTVVLIVVAVAIGIWLAGQR